MSETSNPLPLLEQALSLVTADHAEARYHEAREASTRFANNRITQNVSRKEASLTVKVACGQQVGRASVTDFSRDGLRACVERAEAIARASAPDTEYLPPPGPQSYPVVNGYDECVALATPEVRARGVLEATRRAEAAGLQSAGSFTTNSTHVALANSAGLQHELRLTRSEFLCTAMSGDSSGWSQQVGFRLPDANPAAAGETAVSKALQAREPRALPPGEYTVILEPAAVVDFFGFFGWTLDAKTAHEGRSAFTGKEGERVGAPHISLYTQPDYPELPCDPAGEDGLAVPRTAWIEEGVLRSLSYGRYWAEKTGHPFTGEPANLIMPGGEQSLEELIRGVKRGVLVTRFWYIRFVDPMSMLLTGMTRDGLFWIEDGEVRHGLKNMRFNESPLRCLERITALGQPAHSGRYLGTYMPAMRVEDFSFTSGTAF